ncbi:LysR family transcriptional regulator [Microbacterium sp. LWS13-1.2]|uniref:LysR family transcriptional regulator n=1 Tax=Microbacterium sp. LWS13-1.2 TaxID=3135264 RepID=A0AAU6SE61_9MICO
MDIRQLTWFLAIADARSFSKAAASAFVAQPAMSQQMQKLERELGVELFDRTSRPIRLTPAGEHLYARAVPILGEVQKTQMEVQEFSGEFRGRIVTGSMQYLASVEMADILAAYRNAHPAVELQMRIGNSGQLLDLLRARQLDIAYCHADGVVDEDEFDVRVLREEELVVIVGPRHPAADGTTMRVDDLLDQPLITFPPGAASHEALERIFATAGAAPKAWFESADMATAIALVTRGLGVALVPRSVASRDASIAPLSISPVPVTLHVAQVSRLDRPRSLAIDAFASRAAAALSSTRYSPG